MHVELIHTSFIVIASIATLEGTALQGNKVF